MKWWSVQRHDLQAAILKNIISLVRKDTAGVYFTKVFVITIKYQPDRGYDHHKMILQKHCNYDWSYDWVQ